MVRSILIDYRSIIDFCETDSESAENLEAGVFNDADHDHARVLQNYQSIDRKSINKLLNLSFGVRSS